jgi:membrane protein
VTAEETSPGATLDERRAAKRTAELAERAKASAAARLSKAEAWAAETHQRRSAWDAALALRARDESAFASVLGSAIALRLFLFSVALVVALMSGLSLVLGRAGVDSLVSGVGLAGEMAEEVSRSTGASAGRDLGVLLSSLFVALSAGRSLTKVLTACSAGAWQLPAAEARASVRVVARVTALVALVVIAASGLNRLRDQFGIAVATSSLALNVAMLGIGWFFVTLSLPRPTRDPGAMLPGAALFAVVLTLVQWFMHFYLPFRIEASSQTMGSLSVTVASLGYLFVIGRLMAGTVVLNAVVFEQFGSISSVVFGLPVIERIPRRFPKVATFFDLHLEPAPAGDPAPRG